MAAPARNRVAAAAAIAAPDLEATFMGILLRVKECSETAALGRPMVCIHLSYAHERVWLRHGSK
jgi:hypothetical protein